MRRKIYIVRHLVSLCNWCTARRFRIFKLTFPTIIYFDNRNLSTFLLDVSILLLNLWSYYPINMYDSFCKPVRKMFRLAQYLPRTARNGGFLGSLYLLLAQYPVNRHQTRLQRLLRAHIASANRCPSSYTAVLIL